MKLRFPFAVKQISATEVEVLLNPTSGKPLPMLEMRNGTDVADAFRLDDSQMDDIMGKAHDAAIKTLIIETIQVEM
jgi:hypothetical protein